MKSLIDKLQFRMLIVKEKVASYMEPILGFNFLERENEKFVRYTPKKKIIYNIITIPGIDEYVKNHPAK